MELKEAEEPRRDEEEIIRRLKKAAFRYVNKGHHEA